MKIRKYISRHFILRFCLLLAMVSAAALFDMYHSPSLKIAKQAQKFPTPDQSDSNKIFFYNQVSSNNLKTPGNDVLVRFRFACTQDKFLLKYYNLRTFQMMKAETVHACFPTVNLFHSLPFNRVIYSSPDDTPPLS